MAVHSSLMLLANADADLAVDYHEHRRLQAGHTSKYLPDQEKHVEDILTHT